MHHDELQPVHVSQDLTDCQVAWQIFFPVPDDWNWNAVALPNSCQKYSKLKHCKFSLRYRVPLLLENCSFFFYYFKCNFGKPGREREREKAKILHILCSLQGCLLAFRCLPGAAQAFFLCFLSCLFFLSSLCICCFLDMVGTAAL